MCGLRCDAALALKFPNLVIAHECFLRVFRDRWLHGIHFRAVCNVLVAGTRVDRVIFLISGASGDLGYVDCGKNEPNY